MRILYVKFEEGTSEGRPVSDFQKLNKNDPIKESKSEMKLIFELTNEENKSFEEEIDIYKDKDGDYYCNIT